MKEILDSFNSRSTLEVDGNRYDIFGLKELKKNVERLPFSLKVLLENLLRHEDGSFVGKDDIEALMNWSPTDKPDKEISFMPARVLMQDFTGVPAVVDLAAMREAIVRMGGDAKAINPLQQSDLVIDHSVQVDQFGSSGALRFNSEKEYQRNNERYSFLRWGQGAFRNFRVVPPETGICHQVNLEYLGKVVIVSEADGKVLAYPDTLVGTDSHTTMINGLGILGWGVGGIEAEAAMLGQPYSMLIPEVVGFKLHGHLPEGATATDLVLVVVQMLRKKGVVGKFVEYYGQGLGSLSLADRATISNMSPEYGATVGFFPVDSETMNYMRLTGRDEGLVKLVEAYCKDQGLFRSNDMADPIYTDTLELDLATVEPSLAGPKRPQDRVRLSEAKESFREALTGMMADPTQESDKKVSIKENGHGYELGNGSVVISAITSCTNTSNPSVMIAAGLLAKKAVERGLETKPWVKTSLAPGSKVVSDYLKETDLLPYLEKLGFHLVGFGCTTCIGNSGPLPDHIAEGIKDGDLVAVSVLSGNRNFEGRINALTRANYLASPPLVVAYALTGRMDMDLYREPLGRDKEGADVYLRDIWPTSKEIQDEVHNSVKTEMFRKEYSEVFSGDEKWKAIEIPAGELYKWDSESTYVKNPPFFDDMPPEPKALEDIVDARVLALLGDSVTTDHISPAGSIPADGPAGVYLIEQGVEPVDFNSFGSRRGNHEVMMRGTFANIRLRNLMLPGSEGGWTVHLPDGEETSIYEAAMRYKEEGVPSIVIAGKEYGTGSSRDWAAKGPSLLGVEAAIAESFERIHRSNLIGMGVLPLQFKEGENRETLGLSGRETYNISGIAAGLKPGAELKVSAKGEDGAEKEFTAIARVDTPEEVAYYEHGGILQYVLRQLLGSES